MSLRPVGLICFAFLSSCRSELSVHGSAGTPAPTGPGTPELPVGRGGLRLVGSAPGVILLTPREYDAALAVAFGDRKGRGERLPNQAPPTTSFPFDNLVEQTVVSAPKVDTYEQLAQEIAADLMADDARLGRLPCIPSSPSDRACFDRIVTRLGLAALRRPLTADEHDVWLELVERFAAAASDWKPGVETYVRLLLQHPDFLFRWEIGAPLDARKTMFELDDFELATRLTFTLWGEPPSLDLLDAVAGGLLSSRESYETLVDVMLHDPRTAAHLKRFHAMWLGYGPKAGEPAVNAMLRTEADAMIERLVVREDRAWADLVTFDETWLDGALAAHYGLPAPQAGAGWVRHGDANRTGLFGTGAFLTAGPGRGDTSVTQRGYNIRKNLFGEFVPPPPANVNKDDPLGDPALPTRCNEQNRRNTVLKDGQVCQGCHRKMDLIGFGLERWSLTGQYRETQPDAPECTLPTEGEVVGYGTFFGPSALGKLALDSGRLERTLVQRWLQFTWCMKGDPNLEPLTAVALESFRSDGKLLGFIRRVVVSDAFRLRAAQEQ